MLGHLEEVLYDMRSAEGDTSPLDLADFSRRTQEDLGASLGALAATYLRDTFGTDLWTDTDPYAGSV